VAKSFIGGGKKIGRVTNESCETDAIFPEYG